MTGVQTCALPIWLLRELMADPSSTELVTFEDEAPAGVAGLFRPAAA